MFRVSPGKSSLSSFRLEKLRAVVSNALPNIHIADACHWYFVALNTDLSATEASLLDKLLDLKDAGEEDHRGEGRLQHLLVVPRLGTISPWSSKATDIAQHCSLHRVERIERGVVYSVKTKDGKALTQAELKVLLPLLHDRMTESVFDPVVSLKTGFNDVAKKIFRHGEPLPLSTVDIMHGGSAALAAANIEMGLALSSDEIDYLVESFHRIGRNPTDVELMMFAQ
ncbi:MAG: phosphoribosylformylglycinamidine synthase, partial [Candidatus Nitrotoga sp.]|nr:phosphoribosylformylglycinamidine synthase [Candidatus Nitrotoga sp.]